MRTKVLSPQGFEIDRLFESGCTQRIGVSCATQWSETPGYNLSYFQRAADIFAIVGLQVMALKKEHSRTLTLLCSTMLSFAIGYPCWWGKCATGSLWNRTS